MKNTLKKLIVTVLALVAVLTFSSCEKGKSDPSRLTAEEKYKIASGLVGSSVAAITEKIGEAGEVRHSARCGTNGEDYEYNYGGFSVFTYKEGDKEVVEEVSKN